MSDPKEAAKRLVGYAAVDRYVEAGMCVGLGTGTTAYWAIKRTGERVAAGEQLTAVVTSAATQQLCREFGVPVVPFMSRRIDVAIDGADEVAPDWALTKGGGGALFREKAIAIAAERFIVIVDDSKVVDQLGRFPTPVEVVPFTLPWVQQQIAAQFPSAKAIERVRDGRRTGPTTATRSSTAPSASLPIRASWRRRSKRFTGSSTWVSSWTWRTPCCARPRRASANSPNADNSMLVRGATNAKGRRPRLY